MTTKDLDRTMTSWFVRCFVGLAIVVLFILFLIGNQAAKAGPRKETVSSILIGGAGR